MTHFYLPLAKSIASWTQKKNEPLIIGINGAQGTGKSTLSKVLALALKHEHQLETAILSIDDIYLTRQERSSLAKDIHPLLITRGVPGTHDVSMGINLINQLKSKQPTQLPVFDKATDDRAPEEQWINTNNSVDVVLFEGWCVGAQPQRISDLAPPYNDLEQSEDPDGTWRTYVNQQLAGPYSQLFELIDHLVMLKAPDFECVYEWRSTQEEKLRQRTAEHEQANIMNEKQLKRFIAHYERLTRWMFDEMPSRADCVLELNRQHNIITANYSSA